MKPYSCKQIYSVFFCSVIPSNFFLFSLVQQFVRLFLNHWWLIIKNVSFQFYFFFLSIDLFLHCRVLSISQTLQHNSPYIGIMLLLFFLQELVFQISSAVGLSHFFHFSIAILKAAFTSEEMVILGVQGDEHAQSFYFFFFFSYGCYKDCKCRKFFTVQIYCTYCKSVNFFQMLMKPPRRKSKIFLFSMTGPFQLQILVVASPRSSVDLEPVLATRSLTVKFTVYIFLQ